MDTPVVLYMTAGSRDEAERLAKTLVSERLVACVNILGDMQSYYWWEDAVQSEAEIALIAKTMTSRVPEVSDRLAQIHSYDTPCLVALPVSAGLPDFLNWIATETTTTTTTPR